MHGAFSKAALAAILLVGGVLVGQVLVAGAVAVLLPSQPRSARVLGHAARTQQPSAPPAPAAFLQAVLLTPVESLLLRSPIFTGGAPVDAFTRLDAGLKAAAEVWPGEHCALPFATSIFMGSKTRMITPGSVGVPTMALV